MIFDPDRIEEELSAIMKRTSPTEARASLLNLVVFSTPQTKAQADVLLDAVLGRRAARVIHITGSNEAESRLSVSARCYLDHSKRSVCLQEVVIDSGHDGIGRAVSSWAPLLIRDIPVYVVWLDTICGDQGVTDAIIELTDTLVIDSESALRSGERPQRFFTQLVKLSRDKNLALCDLTWQRVLPLCALTADCFESVRLQQKIDSIEEVTVSGCGPAFATLFLCWFGSRIGLRRQDRRGSTAARGAAAEAVQFDLVAPAGRSVRLRQHTTPTAADGIEVIVRFEDNGELCIRTLAGGCAEVESGDTASTRVLPQPSDGETLLNAIDQMQRDHIYTEIVRSIDTFA